MCLRIVDKMIEFRDKHKSNIYSQNGEDGIIAECRFRIYKYKKECVHIDSNGQEHFMDKKLKCVEFGAPTKNWCSNIYQLSQLGHDCKWIDNDPREGGILKATITTDNVNELVGDCDILSIDIDGNDYNVWQAYKYTPDVVIIEINSGLDPLKDWFTPEKGSNFSIMVKLAEVKGYFLLCHTGNLIFVLNKHRKLFKEVKDFTPETINEHFDRSWL